MITLKKRKINGIIELEGGAKYTNDPNDSGKGTRFGITESVARDNGYTGHMRDLPRELAFEIYVARYWNRVRADDLVQISEWVAEEVVDTAVNTGSVQSGEFLQQSLNVLNRAERLYPDIAVDGTIGPATIAALDSYVTHRSDAVLLKALNCLQGAFYIDLATRREKDERFVYGWLKNRVVI